MILHYRNNLKLSDKLQIESILNSSHFFNKEEVIVALELVDDQLNKKENSDYLFLVAEEGNQILGYSCYGRIPFTESSYDLYWIAVDNISRSKGIGSQLLIKTEEKIQSLGGDKIYVETSGLPLYESTVKFYLKNQYLIIAKFEDFYAAGNDKIVFVKKLEK